MRDARITVQLLGDNRIEREISQYTVDLGGGKGRRPFLQISIPEFSEPRSDARAVPPVSSGADASAIQGTRRGGQLCRSRNAEFPISRDRRTERHWRERSLINIPP